MLSKTKKCCMPNNFYRDLKILIPILTLLSNVTIVCHIFVKLNKKKRIGGLLYFCWRAQTETPKIEPQKKTPNKILYALHSHANVTLLSSLTLQILNINQGRNLYLFPN